MPKMMRLWKVFSTAVGQEVHWDLTEFALNPQHVVRIDPSYTVNSNEPQSEDVPQGPIGNVCSIKVREDSGIWVDVKGSLDDLTRQWSEAMEG